MTKDPAEIADRMTADWNRDFGKAINDGRARLGLLLIAAFGLIVLCSAATGMVVYFLTRPEPTVKECKYMAPEKADLVKESGQNLICY